MSDDPTQRVEISNLNELSQYLHHCTASDVLLTIQMNQVRSNEVTTSMIKSVDGLTIAVSQLTNDIISIKIDNAKNSGDNSGNRWWVDKIATIAVSIICGLFLLLAGWILKGGRIS